jgi:hypothetical protein
MSPDSAMLAGEPGCGTGSLEPGESLSRALQLSRELASLADDGDIQLTQRLDAERLRLLKSVKSAGFPLAESDWLMLREITELNDRAIGLLDHRRRRKARDFEMAAAGQRAVRAYSATGRRR